ncbi:SMI1/KNR4 family protein [Hymenobacter cellulosivorans]|uniref:SMI1/KNR4 family protein n=1 Tax=Hymenobacter cellulosivorans TaxID=2932249 RepID=A0ABY4FHF7_9BACT|nr:SMI1/KNR4 family protein [Hymenobacter cellulosivorans]UOQ55561.1 SMI1/KNR4 family protein [Hymenobacter cellulosivorans]
MAIEDEIKRLGGLKPIEDQFYPLNKQEVELLEKEANGVLPPDYNQFLTTYGECIFLNSVSFKPMKQEPEYVHDEKLGIPNGSFSGSSLTMFYGKRTKKSTLTIIDTLKRYRERMPEGFVPFADDGLGNQLCISVGPDNYQKVYWWDHEMEWDEEDYEDETGTPMPVSAKYQNVYLLANNFTDFFEKLNSTPPA